MSKQPKERRISFNITIAPETLAKYDELTKKLNLSRSRCFDVIIESVTTQDITLQPAQLIFKKKGQS